MSFACYRISLQSGTERMSAPRSTTFKESWALSLLSNWYSECVILWRRHFATHLYSSPSPEKPDNRPLFNYSTDDFCFPIPKTNSGMMKGVADLPFIGILGFLFLPISLHTGIQEKFTWLHLFSLKWQGFENEFLKYVHLISTLKVIQLSGWILVCLLFSFYIKLFLFQSHSYRNWISIICWPIHLFFFPFMKRTTLW